MSVGFGGSLKLGFVRANSLAETWSSNVRDLVTANTQGYSLYNYLGKAIASNITHSLESHDNSVEAACLSRVVTYNIHALTNALTKLLRLRSRYRVVISKIENLIYGPERRIPEEAVVNEDLVDICYNTQTAGHRVRVEAGSLGNVCKRKHLLRECLQR